MPTLKLLCVVMVPLLLACPGEEPSADAGVPVEDAGFDAGTGPDSGVPEDAGQPDAGGAEDAGTCSPWTIAPADGGCVGAPGALTDGGEAASVEALGGGVTLLRNLTYGQRGGYALQGDLYLPAPSAAAVPPGVLVVVHGGGWSDCGRRRATPDVALYAHGTAALLGIATFNIEYRLLQEGGAHPENVMDVRCALQWIAANGPPLAGALGVTLDGSRLGISGESAGAHLALMAALTHHREDLDPGCGPPAPALALTLAYSAPTDFPAVQPGEVVYGALRANAGPCTESPEACVEGRRCDRCLDASPAAHACEATGQVLLIQAPDPYDGLIPQRHAEWMAAAFADAGYAAAEVVMPTSAAIEAEGCVAGEAHGFHKLCLPTAGSPVTTPWLQATLGPQ